MKKLLILVVVTLFSTTLFANTIEPVDMVKTGDELVFLKNVRVGLGNYLIGTTFDGEKVKFNKKEVLTYSKDGVQYDKMNIIENNCCTGEKCFMELLDWRNGFKLYKYTYCTDTGQEAANYYVFKDDKFVVQLDSKNKANLIKFFNE